MSYFTIELSAKSEQELGKRIVDSEKRGFELVEIKTRTKEGSVWRTKGYGRGYEFRGVDVHTTCIAVMRRDNTEYLRNKGMAQ